MTLILKKSNFLHQPVLYKYQSDYTQKITVHPQKKKNNCNKAKQWNFHTNGNTVTNCSIFDVFSSSFHYLSVSLGAYYISMFKLSIALLVQQISYI